MGNWTKYDGLWTSARPRLLSGALAVDRVPVDGDPRWGLSLVALPSDSVRDRLAAEADALNSTLRGRHHVYEAADMHLTITSLEPYRDHIDPQLLAHYAAAVQEQSDSLNFQVRLTGLGGSAAGVFVQGFDDDTLHPLRAAMRDAATGLHDGEAPPPCFVRDTAHLSLSVHRTQSAEPAAAAFVDARRWVPYGAITGARLALVDYRPVDGLMRLRTLETLR